ncbi:MAG TPA: carboxypeptidase regulatory-like domain-containing protein [Pyrinomonadaceae bacterium]|nr:carboxypeptidase regulatory-like domain-containing protein [Pyrinomonadaceae bacterium]
MSFSGRYVPAVLLACLSMTGSLFAQSTTKQTSKAPRGTVSGRVTIKDKGAAGVVIGIRKSEDFSRLEPMLRATTDQDGFYRLTNVAAGSYNLIPSAPGFVTADPKDMWNKTVILGEDENVEGINFALVRGGVITGRVTDADGRPVIEQQVNIFRVEAFEQQSRQREIYSAGSAQTDDRGIYRVFSLTAGRYKVSIGRADDVSSPFSNTRATYKQVFHPDVSDQAKAAIVEVSEGSEANDVDITVGRPLQTYSASGRVIDAEKGLPVPNMRFAFQRTAGQRVEFLNLPAASNASGEFFVEGLIPGKYAIYLFPNQNLERRAETSFDIVDQDVTGLTIRLIRGASLAGVVVFESEDKAGLQKFPQLQLRAFVPGPNGSGFSNSASSPISPDGSFRLAGLPSGTANIMLGGVAGPFPPKGLSISRIERDGVVVPRGLEIKESEQVTGLRVVVAYGTGTIRGVVKFENGSKPEGTGIFLRVTKVGQNMGPRPPDVDARGQFLIEGLSAGVYEIMASLVGGGVMGGPQPRLPSAKREVTAQDGVVTDVVITINLGTTPPP